MRKRDVHHENINYTIVDKELKKEITHWDEFGDFRENMDLRRQIYSGVSVHHHPMLQGIAVPRTVKICCTRVSIYVVAVNAPMTLLTFCSDVFMLQTSAIQTQVSGNQICLKRAPLI